MGTKIKVCNKAKCKSYNKGSKTNCLTNDNPANIQQQIQVKRCSEEFDMQSFDSAFSAVANKVLE